MAIEMELSRIIISEIHDQQIIYLREVDGDRQFPIVIGIFEATSIDRRVKGHPSPRPLTHDLICNVIEAMNGELECVMITALREGTYFAELRVRLDDEIVPIDARPSDAIAIAVTCNPPLPILVAEEVLDEALNDQNQ